MSNELKVLRMMEDLEVKLEICNSEEAKKNPKFLIESIYEVRESIKRIKQEELSISTLISLNITSILLNTLPLRTKLSSDIILKGQPMSFLEILKDYFRVMLLNQYLQYLVDENTFIGQEQSKLYQLKADSYKFEIKFYGEILFTMVVERKDGKIAESGSLVTSEAEKCLEKFKQGMDDLDSLQSVINYVDDIIEPWHNGWLKIV